jgi:MFS family permease
MLSTLSILVIYFLSGFAALIYQVVWRRLLGLFVGMDVYSVTLVATVFMLGLGAGSLVGGNFAQAINKRVSYLYAFAAIEFLIAASGLMSKPIIYDFLYQSFFHHRLSSQEGFWVVLVTTLIPTFCMGATLPLLSKAYSKTLKEAIGNISYLYAINTLGAALGALITSTVLIRNIGYANTLVVAATVNVVCAVSALFLAHFKKTDGESKETDSQLPIKEEKETSLLFWSIVYTLSGFTALGLEVIWFRLLNVMLKANSMVFGSLLGLYLLGLALGTALGARLFAAKGCSRTTFFLLQAAIPLYAVIYIVVIVNALGTTPLIGTYFDYFGRYNPIYFDSEIMPPKEFFLIFVLLPVTMIVPPSVLMGLSFSGLQHLVQRELKGFERRVGILQASNIFGSAFGAVFVGMVTLNFFGTSGSLYFFLAIGFLFLCCSLKEKGHNVPVIGFCVVLVLLLVPNMPDQEKLWSKLHGHFDHKSFIVHEDSSGVAAYTPLEAGARAYVYVNGQGHSEIPFGGLHSVMGLISAYLHSNPEDVAIIGLGSGDTFFSASSNRKTKNVTCYEILKPEWNCLWKWGSIKAYEPLHRLANDNRLKVEFADARNAICNSDKKFDIIQGDPVRPFDCGAGFLNSLEFFQALKERLKPGGLVFYWASTARARTTFVNAFPYCIEFGAILVGSNDPIKYNKQEVIQNFKDNCLVSFVEATDMNEEDMLVETLDSYLGTAKADPNVLGLNLDLYPRDEFYVPQLKQEVKLD